MTFFPGSISGKAHRSRTKDMSLCKSRGEHLLLLPGRGVPRALCKQGDHDKSVTWQAMRMRKLTTVSVCCFSTGLVRRVSVTGIDVLRPNTYTHTHTGQGEVKHACIFHLANQKAWWSCSLDPSGFPDHVTGENNLFPADTYTCAGRCYRGDSSSGGTEPLDVLSGSRVHREASLHPPSTACTGPLTTTTWVGPLRLRLGKRNQISKSTFYSCKRKSRRNN